MSQDHNHLNHAIWECKYHVVFTLRIPTMTTTRSDGWRPPVPIDDDHGGAEDEGAVRCIF
jgi:hypothetical protein